MGTEWRVTISEGHPSLAGHFPGHPVVPGVVMLGEIMNFIRQATGRNIECVGMPSVKFLSPLKPGEPLTVRLDQQADDTMAFTCVTGSRLITSGCMRYRIVTDASTGDS